MTFLYCTFNFMQQQVTYLLFRRTLRNIQNKLTIMVVFCKREKAIFYFISFLSYIFKWVFSSWAYLCVGFGFKSYLVGTICMYAHGKRTSMFNCLDIENYEFKVSIRRLLCSLISAQSLYNNYICTELLQYAMISVNKKNAQNSLSPLPFTMHCKIARTENLKKKLTA